MPEMIVIAGPHTGEEPDMEEEQQRYQRARARVQALKGFYIHATANVMVNITLFAKNVLVGGGDSTGC
jgi:2TM domain